MTRQADGRMGGGAAVVIARRDLLEFVRDRRTLFITLLMPLVTYPMLALSSSLGVRSALREVEGAGRTERLTIACSGSDAEAWARRVSELEKAASGRPAGWPDQLEGRVVPAEEAGGLIESGEADAWIELPAGTLATLDTAGTVQLDVRLAARGPAKNAARPLVAAVLRGVADDARHRRLDRAGLPATLLDPLAVNFQGAGAAAPAQVAAPTVAGAVLVLLAMLMVTGAYYPACDAIAGEKERGTIETLLIAPCRTGQLVLGKFAAVFAVTLATLAVNAVSLALTATIVVRMLPAAAVVSPAAAIGSAAVTLIAYAGLAGVSAALCLAVTSASKSVKEAQNTITPLVILISALAAAALLPGADGNGWLAAVPFAGQVAVARAALASALDGGSGAATVACRLALSLGSSAAVTAVCLKLTTAALGDEDLIFRGPDVAAGLRRPAARPLPTPAQAFSLALASFALLWYSQGLGGTDLAAGLIAQQALALAAPLAASAWWQRIDATATYALRWPGGSAGGGVAALFGAALLGAGLFVVGAAAFVGLWGSDVSAAARELTEQLTALVRRHSASTSVLLLAVIPACCEELVFRGWMLAGFAGDRPSRGRVAAAIVAQAALFAAFHLLPERMPQTFAMGLALGWATRVTRSLLPAVVAHAAHNATPLLLLRLEAAGDAEIMPAWAVAAAVGCLVAGTALVAASGRRGTGG